MRLTFRIERDATPSHLRRVAVLKLSSDGTPNDRHRDEHGAAGRSKRKETPLHRRVMSVPTGDPSVRLP
jgi:hypothetical protein